MTFNYYYQFNILNSVLSQAEEYIQLNDRKSLKKLIESYGDIGTWINYINLSNSEPLFQTAIVLDRDDIVLDLYISNPSEIKQYIYKTNLDNLIIYADILGNSVINRRHDLVERLLDLKGVYKLNIDGIKDTNNDLLNFYHLVDNGENKFEFRFDKTNKYITSPLMLSLLIGDFEMYEILKSRGAFFNIEDKNCKFHLDYCKNEKIIEDIYKSFKN